jgi:hypothetical protein
MKCNNPKPHSAFGQSVIMLNVVYAECHGAQQNVALQQSAFSFFFLKLVNSKQRDHNN